MKKNINLLPPDQQNQLRLEQKNSQIKSFGFWLIFSLAVLAFVLWIGQRFLSVTAESTRQELALASEELERLETSLVQKKVEIINRDILNFKELNSRNLKWSPFLMELARLLPRDVSVDTLVINQATKRVEISGKAERRESVLEFRENLLSSESFQNVNFPLYNLESPRNVNWKYRFYLKTLNTK